jgi:Domain of unknown function (DUF3576)
MNPRVRCIPMLLVAGLALAACGNSTANPTQPNYMGSPSQVGGSSSIFGDEGLSIGNSKTDRDDSSGSGGSGGIGVNAYLWRGALDTLGFMPLASADPFGGVIITDWYTPPGTSGERFKATAYILGRQLRSDGVRVAIYRQLLQPDGQWADASVSPVTVGEIEDKVLARARQLREQSAGS